MIQDQQKAQGPHGPSFNYASHVFIVTDLEEAQRYYSDVLGFAVDGEFVMRDGVQFLFKESKVEGAVRPNRRVGVELDTYIWVDDVNAVYQEFKASGANIIFGPENMAYRMRDLIVEDLYGYRLCFGAPLGLESEETR
ncbi:VOC family protein [Paenibacillus xanthanilyticus]|uniref:VOC family protein n=1 Tax=Paenibacillus xanthanilyticus TaxID=1783531 RepID=A0ABV8JVY7_9BACL